MTGCPYDSTVLGAYLDGELDAANVALVEAHSGRCGRCRGELDRLQAVRSLVGRPENRHRASDSLKDRIAALPELSPAEPRAKPSLPSWLAPGVAGAMAASLAMILLVPPSAESGIDGQLVSSHVRSLQPGHLIDVQTSNQHVVKPWFNGKVDFSPPVPELSPAGFPLAGGRLDSIDGRTVAAIVYRRRLHTINLFVWPASGRVRDFQADGFNVAEWQDRGLRFAAVSDIGRDELAQFEQAFRQSAYGHAPS